MGRYAGMQAAEIIQRTSMSIKYFIELEVNCGFLIGFLPGDRIAWIRGNESVCRTISQHSQ